MFLSKLFKRTKSKVMVAIAGLTMVLGAGAAISTVAATQQNEVVETKAASVTYDGSGLVWLNLDGQASNWWASGATIWVDVYDAGGNHAQAQMVQTSMNSYKYYKAAVPAGTWTNLCFVRINGSSFNWNNKWAQTNYVDAPNLLSTHSFHLTAYESMSAESTYFDVADQDGWFLVGDETFRSSVGTSSGIDWKYTSGFMMTPDEDNEAKALGIRLLSGSHFKARWWSGTTGGWATSVSYDTSSGATGFGEEGGNLSITSTRNYDVYYQKGGNLYITNSKRTVTFNANGHGTAPSALENVIDGNTISAPTAPTATGYTFGGWYKEAGCSNAWTFASDVVSADITLYAKWTVNKYAVTIVGGTGISSVYLSTSSSATSGSASGTKFDYDATVYGFVVLSAGYAHQNTWALVSGTDDTSGAKYRVGSLTVTTSGNAFGTKTPISGESFAIAWATGFNNAIRGDNGGVCDSDGNTNTSSLATAWGSQSSAYAALAGYKQYWLAEATKSGDSNVTTALAQYDYVCGKYGPNGQKISGITDFMGRNPSVPVSSVLVPGASSTNQSPLTLTLWIVLGAGILGLGAIGTAYFVSKKKKRHQA